MTETTTVGIVQEASVFFDLVAAAERAAEHVGQAAARGADIVVFPEAWLGGFPAWIFGLAGWDDPEAKKWYAALVEHAALVTPGASEDDLTAVRRAAGEFGVSVLMGINERSAPGSGTVYNSLVTIDPSGIVRNIHRKLSPTHSEKLVWAPGDAHGLAVQKLDGVRVGGLICWEHWNPLARQVLHAQHEDIHVGIWPDAPHSHQLATQSYAFEGRCHTVLAASWVTLDDLPDGLAEAYLSGLGDEVSESHGILLDGGSAVAAPDGTWLLEPVRGRPGVLTATIDLRVARGERLAMDIGGHYQRPDVFNLSIDTRRHPPGACSLTAMKKLLPDTRATDDRPTPP